MLRRIVRVYPRLLSAVRVPLTELRAIQAAIAEAEAAVRKGQVVTQIELPAEWFPPDVGDGEEATAEAMLADPALAERADAVASELVPYQRQGDLGFYTMVSPAMASVALQYNTLTRLSLPPSLPLRTTCWSATRLPPTAP